MTRQSNQTDEAVEAMARRLAAVFYDPAHYTWDGLVTATRSVWLAVARAALAALDHAGEREKVLVQALESIGGTLVLESNPKRTFCRCCLETVETCTEKVSSGKSGCEGHAARAALAAYEQGGADGHNDR